MVGDRLDTDIEGAHAAGVDSLLVLTGVTGLAELVEAGARLRPTYIAPDLGGLLMPHRAPERQGGASTLGGWQARVAGGRLQVDGGGAVEDWWRVVVAAAWLHLDSTGQRVEVSGVEVPAG
jgi:hypothetical protein